MTPSEIATRRETLGRGEDASYAKAPDGSVVVVARDPERPGSLIVHCHGTREHYRHDGSCEHVDLVLACQKADSAPMRPDYWMAR